jgi:hypothetical protein
MVHNKEQLKCNQCNHPKYNVLSNVPFGASFLAVLLKDRLFARGTTLPAAQRRPRLVLEESEGSTSQRVKARPSQGQVMSGALVIHVILVASRQTEKLLGTSWNHSKTGNLSVVLEPN